jgi:RNA polymerase sigma-70 factor (ECF subfamily)
MMRPHALRTDHALLLATAAGDEAAFAALVARHRPRLVRYATSRCGRDASLAEDAVQDALVRAHRAIVGGKVPVDVQAWLFAIVRNRCHDYFRAARSTAPLPAELPGGSPSAFEEVERSERLAGALNAVDQLPAAQRAAILGRELEGRSYEDIAERQATTVSAVKSLLHRARATLAHQTTVPAFAAPLVARLARMRPGQAVLGLITEQTTGVAAIAAISLAGTNALGSLHLPTGATGPTAAQGQAALATAAKRPPGVVVAPRRDATAAAHRPTCSALDAEYARPDRC